MRLHLKSATACLAVADKLEPPEPAIADDAVTASSSALPAAAAKASDKPPAPAPAPKISDKPPAMPPPKTIGKISIAASASAVPASVRGANPVTPQGHAGN